MRFLPVKEQRLSAAIADPKHLTSAPNALLRGSGLRSNDSRFGVRIGEARGAKVTQVRRIPKRIELCA